MPNKLFAKQNSFKIHILLVVNGRTGCTHVEVLTGTHGIPQDWRHTDGMRAIMRQRKEERGDAAYKVS